MAPLTRALTPPTGQLSPNLRTSCRPWLSFHSFYYFACVWTEPHVLPVTGPNHASVAVGGLLFCFVCDSVALPSALPSAFHWLHPLLLAIATTDIRFYCSHSDLLFIFVFSLYSLPRCSHLSTCCYLLHLGYCCYFSASHPSPIRTTGRSQKQKPP